MRPVLYSLAFFLVATVCGLSSPATAGPAVPYGYYINAAVCPEVPRINAHVVKKLFDQGKLLLANAMESANYQADYLVGSISLAADKITPDLTLPRNVVVAIYCN